MSVWVCVCVRVSVCVCVCVCLCVRECVCVEHLNRCKTSTVFLICRGTWHTIRDHVQRSYLIVWDTEPDQLCVPSFFQFSVNGTRLSPKPHHRIFRLHVRLPQSAFTMVLFYWFEPPSISEFRAALRMGIVIFGHFTTLRLFLHGNPDEYFAEGSV